MANFAIRKSQKLLNLIKNTFFRMSTFKWKIVIADTIIFFAIIEKRVHFVVIAAGHAGHCKLT